MVIRKWNGYSGTQFPGLIEAIDEMDVEGIKVCKFQQR